MTTNMTIYRREWYCDILKTHHIDKWPQIVKGGVEYSLWNGKEAVKKFTSDKDIRKLIDELS